MKEIGFYRWFMEPPLLMQWQYVVGKTDEGWYGKGIYFTIYLSYTVPKITWPTSNYRSSQVISILLLNLHQKINEKYHKMAEEYQQGTIQLLNY